MFNPIPVHCRMFTMTRADTVRQQVSLCPPRNVANYLAKVNSAHVRPMMPPSQQIYTRYLTPISGVMSLWSSGTLCYYGITALGISWYLLENTPRPFNKNTEDEIRQVAWFTAYELYVQQRTKYYMGVEIPTFLPPSTLDEAHADTGLPNDIPRDGRTSVLSAMRALGARGAHRQVLTSFIDCWAAHLDPNYCDNPECFMLDEDYLFQRVSFSRQVRRQPNLPNSLTQRSAFQPVSAQAQPGSSTATDRKSVV